MQLNVSIIRTYLVKISQMWKRSWLASPICTKFKCNDPVICDTSEIRSGYFWWMVDIKIHISAINSYDSHAIVFREGLTCVLSLSLVQTMACRLFGTKPLSKSMTSYKIPCKSGGVITIDIAPKMNLCTHVFCCLKQRAVAIGKSWLCRYTTSYVLVYSYHIWVT